MPRFSRLSEERLLTCDTQIQEVFRQVIIHRDCSILEGHRGHEAQMHAYSTRRSRVKYPNSKHNKTPSQAVDVMPWYPEKPHIRWDMSNASNSHELREFAGFVLGVAAAYHINLRWGGHYRTFFDGPHYELFEASKTI